MGLIYTDGAPKPLRYPDGADLYFDFRNGPFYFGGVPSLVRSTSALMLGPNGYQSFAAGQLARIDGYGAQVAPARTNGIRNNSMVGAIVGTPGTPPTNWSLSPLAGVVVQILGTGTEYGLPYLDISVAGTATGGVNLFFETSTAIAATNGQTWIFSIFARLLSGSLANLNLSPQMAEWGGAGAFVTSGSGAGVVATNEITRSQYVRTLSGGAGVVAVSPLLQLQATGAVNASVRIYAPQLELGSFASPPIITTGAAATRAGDLLTAAVPDGGRAFVFDIDIRGYNVAAGSRWLCDWSDGTSGNRYTLSILNDSTLIIDVASGGSYIGGLSFPIAGSMVGRHRIFGVIAGGYIFGADLGAAEPTPNTGLGAPVGINRVGLGGNGRNTSNNTLIHLRRSAERAVTDFATHAEARAWAKSVAQEWAA